MENKKTKNISLAIMGILVLVELIAISISLANEIAFFSVCQAFVLILVTLYGFWLYKKPNGNMLKYALLLIAAAQLLSIIEAFSKNYGAFYPNAISVFEATIVVYVAGRLNRIDQNKILFPLVVFITLSIAIYYTITLPTNNVLLLLSYFNLPITFLTLMIAYFVRYKEHKEAGISDK